MTKDAVTVWTNCLQFIEDNITPHLFDTWFKPIQPVKLENSSLSIQVPSKFFFEWLEEHYAELLKVALRKELGRNAKLVYNIKMENKRGSAPAYTENIPSTKRKKIDFQDVDNKKGNRPELKNPFVIPGIKNLKIDSQLNSNYNFDNFLEGESNRLARSAGRAVANKPGGTSFNPLLVFGGSGLGKTHLAHAIGVDIKEKYPEKTVLYISSEKFTQQFIDSVTKRNNRNDFIHFYQLVDVLIVDDIQLLSGKAGTQEAFFHIFNHLHQNGKQVILTSDKAPVDMQEIEQRLLSRFKWGLSAELQAPDYETRVSIIQSKLYRDGVEMPQEIIEYLAENVKHNIRELEGAIISLIAHSSFSRKEIDLELAERVVGNFVRKTKKELSIDQIQKVVSEYFDMDVSTLQSKTRKRHIVQARQIAMYFSKKMTKSSLANIGKEIGKRDHATVLHACKTVDNLKSTDKNFNKYVEDLQIKLKS